MRAALSVALLASVAAFAKAGSIQTWEGADCTGTKQSDTFTSGKCYGESGGSGTVTCSGSTWTFSVYSTSDCSGTALVTFPNGQNGVCTNLQIGGVTALSVNIDCNGCFSGSSTLQLESGAVTPVANVNVGDRVLAMSSNGETFFDKVFRITHHEPTEVMDFVRITTSSGDVLEVSPTHTVHVGTCCSAGNAVQASEVAVGNKMFVAKESGKMVQEVTVTAVETVSRTGVFNLHTLSSNVIVSNVAATHYGKPAWTAAPELATYWYHVRDAMSTVVGAEDASVKADNVSGHMRNLVASVVSAVETGASASTGGLRSLATGSSATVVGVMGSA